MQIRIKIRVILLTTFCLFLAHGIAAEEDWFGKGLAYMESHQYDDAVKAFSIAIETIPQDYQAYNFRGVTYAYQGDYDRAIADYSAALKIKPDYAAAVNNRGFAWVKKGNLDQALEDFTRAIELEPSLVDAYNSKAWILATSSNEAYRKSADALELAKKAVEIKTDIDSLDTLAAAYAANGQFAEAIATQKEAIHLLIRQDRTDELAPYIAHLETYSAHKPLRQDYAVRTTAGKPAPPPAKSEKSFAAQKVSPSVRPPATEADGPYPYTIQVSAYRESERSIRAATSLIDRGDPAFACPVRIPGKGDWHRVFIGSYRSLEEANKAAAELKKRKFEYIHVTRQPYAVELGLFESDQEARRITSRLRTKGYMAYRLPDPGQSGKTRLLIGAYPSEAEAQELAAQLKKDGFDSRVLPR